MTDTHGGGLDAASVEVLGGSVAHWVSHMFGPEVYELYSADLQAMHGRLHDELLGLLPEAPDASIWVWVELDVVDTSVACPAHPTYVDIPPPVLDGMWLAGLRIHRHSDSSPGVEADDDLVCNLLCALASYGGSVLIGVHPPRESAEQGAPEAPLVAGAKWRVDPVGTGLPQHERPTLMISRGGPLDHDRSPLRMAVDMTPPAGGPSAPWRAITGALWDAPDTYDTTEWRAADPDGFLTALEEAVSRLARCPELNHPVVMAATLAHLRQSVQTAEEKGDTYSRAVLAAAVAHQAHEYSLFTTARELSASGAVDPAMFAAEVVGFITYYWRAALAGTLLLPPPDPALDTDSLNQLRALIGRTLSRR
ncbi:hypothetical protein AB0O20_02325 [Streptomyces kronopolitis]|uniref:hypothetical protein n=1 Tax=Streptomyces kronopolitis TaxID=1612435 RepID=UPI00344AB926